ncbi:MAG TPA: class I SAM-dependent methyltransferase [Spirochaetota bacterium]|nr:class I SAM-dependent methyltransferase [Spirochaetota bacterium]
MKLAVRASLSGHKLGTEMGAEERLAAFMNIIDVLNTQPVALRTADTKRQHYEVPTEFFVTILGDHMKYSCCLWDDNALSFRIRRDLTRAEDAMLELTVIRSQVQDGHRVLELGCGWGSLSLYIARRFPRSRITAVSHSSTQKAYIESRARELGLGNLEVVTADMNDFTIDAHFDRVISVEMFEHMRNYRELMRRIADWLVPGGKLFVHIFTIEGIPYFFDADKDEDWMARTFFSGGIMPSTELLLFFADDMAIERAWKVNGRHYEKTLLSWLFFMDRQKKDIMRVFNKTYGADAIAWWNRWRLFFLSCTVSFGFRDGNVWNVTHYRFTKKR